MSVIVSVTNSYICIDNSISNEYSIENVLSNKSGNDRAINFNIKIEIDLFSIYPPSVSGNDFNIRETDKIDCFIVVRGCQ